MPFTRLLSSRMDSICLLLIYTLAISLFAPFAIKRAGAAPADKTTAGSIIRKAPAPVAVRAQEQTARWREGELLVRFREHAPISKMNALLRTNGAQWNGRLRGQSRIERLRLAAGADPEAVAARLRSGEFVEFAEPNYLITADQTATQPSPDDPRYSEQSALQNTVSSQAWTATTGAKRTVIAVIDSGIDFSHPDLSNNQWDNSLEQANNRDNDGNGFNSDLHGWDFITNSAAILDGQGHGTAVAGIIASQGNNGIGITGVMWRAGLMSLRVLDHTGTGDIATAVEAIDYATTNGAQVINCSWGTENSSLALREAINRAAGRGVVVITSAGNSSRDIETTAHYPASFDLPNLIAVAATDNADVLTPSSNWGAMRISIAAPGTDILSTKMGGDYQKISGTSASAPFVTGVAGLIKTLRPWLSSERTRELILRGARQVPSLSDKVASKGIVSATGAAEVLNTLPPNEGLEESSDINSGEHANNGSGRSNPLNTRPDSRNQDGTQPSITPLPRKQGAPLPGLPNLDELRGRQPVNPQKPDPIPSTRCSHRDPNCASRNRQAAIETLPDLLAWGINAPSTPSLSENSSQSISDSPFQLFWSAPASLAAPLPQSIRTNVALESNGATAMLSSQYDSTFPASAAINGDRYNLYQPDGRHNLTHSAAGASKPDWLEVNFGANKLIDEIDVVTMQDSYTTPINPTETTTFTLYGLTNYEVQYLNGSTWVDVPNGNITGNNKVWRKFTFPAITTSRIRVLVSATADTYSRIMEVEAWGIAGTNVALSTNGGSATASSTYSGAGYNYTPDAAINDERKGTPSSSNLWHDAAPGNTFPDWLQVVFQSTKTIDEIDVFTLQDNYNNPVEPTETMTFSLYGLTGYDVQYWDGSAWMNVPGGHVTSNNKVWRKLTFSAITTNKIRVLTNASGDGHSRITEVQAWETSASAPVNSVSMERLDPSNRTGGGGVDLLSRNANWSLPILGLKGRAGLDLGLSLSYNSLIWTKSQDGTAIKFDADQGSPSPGFRLGFPVIQPRYYNSQVGAYAYLMITPSGAHVELRQVGSSNVYESADSSYLQMIDSGNGSLTLRPTDGSQLSYSLKGDQYQCTGIKDRNGNYITVNYDAINTIANTGRMTSIVDTLGRTINFNYDSFFNLITITQDWGGVSHRWATFDWNNLTIQTSFNSNLTVIGPQNGVTIPVLSSVRLSDDTYYKFEYNTWGQVRKVTSYAADSQQNGQMMDTHPRNYSFYTLATSAGQTDCPRVTDSRAWAENWNGINGVPAEVITQYGVEAGGIYKLTAPDGTIYKEFYGTGWQKGLVTKAEHWSGGLKMKWTETTYTQDDTNLTYEKNPRVIETNISDSDGRHKRTTINYDLYAAYGLPHQVDEYDSDGVTLLRRTYTDYNLSQAYLVQRIIGLVSAVHMSDGTGWKSKIKYEYDATGEQLVATSSTTAQHDAAYDANLTVVRGNLTSVSRYDVTDSDNELKKLKTSIGYDTNGSVIFTRDPSGHQTKVSYEDSFSDNNNSRNTFAYPTKATPPVTSLENPESFSSTTQYNYYFGSVTRTQGPLPAVQTVRPEQTMQYDAVGRLSRVDTPANEAHQRWVYGLDGAVATFTTIQTGAPEAYNVTYWDGVGRVSAQGGDNPNSTGLYSGQHTYYDIMGRPSHVSNPTEMNASWIPTGDDAAGWVYTQQAYDWKGRPTVTTNPDGTTKVATYGGCGCAGGEVVTVKDEVGRQQRMTADILGRPWKTEVLDWYPSQTVYSTTTNTYDARDQVTSVIEAGGSASQTTTLTYDGYGRLMTQQAPSQTAATTYVYNPDDTVQSVTDARGVISTFSYNNRHQTTGISYNPSAGITDTPDVTFAYDAAGNHTSMTDGSGSVAYSYDQLSRLTSESRQFSDLPGITRTLSYQYNLANQLTSITDPFDTVINYSYDKTGRMTDITGSSFAGVTQYASNMKYRAWGAAKSASYGDNTALSVSYNSSLLPTDMAITNSMAKHYEYNADGRLRYSQDSASVGWFDRSYTYDHAGQIITATSGAKARGLADTDDRPYDLTYEYDALNHLKARTGRMWNAISEANTGSGIYANNKNTGWQYDSDGRLIDSGEIQYTYDAASRAAKVVSLHDEVTLTQRQVFDGNGVRTKLNSQQDTYHESTNTTTTETKSQYFVTSSVLGSVITELDQSGGKTRTFVYNGGQVLAMQKKSGSTETIDWEHRDLSNASVRGNSSAGELEPMGSNAGLWNPFVSTPPQKNFLNESRIYPGYSDLSGGQCTLDGIDTPCERAFQAASSGAATIDPSTPPSDVPGATPIYGLFCVEDPYIGDEPLTSHGVRQVGRMDCTYDITGYTPANFNLSGIIPQDIPGQKDLSSLISDTRNIIKNATGDCKKLLGKDALQRFDKISSNIQFNGDIPTAVEGLDGRLHKGKLSDVPQVNAVAYVDHIYLNPGGYAFGKFSNFPRLNQYFTEMGAAGQREYALATVIHEFLHTTGKFKPDSNIGLDGKIDIKKGEKYQKEVLTKCFPKK